MQVKVIENHIYKVNEPKISHFLNRNTLNELNPPISLMTIWHAPNAHALRAWQCQKLNFFVESIEISRHISKKKGLISDEIL